jgi:hypothetical protein
MGRGLGTKVLKPVYLACWGECSIGADGHGR